MKLREIKVGLMLLLPWQEAWAAEAFTGSLRRPGE